jgi:hypothetical protein
MGKGQGRGSLSGSRTRTRSEWSKLLTTGAFILLCLLSLTSRGAAQVPERFSFQGYLEDGNGQPLAPTTPVNYDVVFRIFPNASSPTPVLWAERQTVTVDKGNYSVILGQGVQVQPENHGDLSAVVGGATGSELYVQTTVNVNGSDTTLLPRLRLLPSAYSFLAKKALTADQALSVNGAAIVAGSIQQDRLSVTVVSNITSSPIPDARLSGNVALRGAANTFVGNQTLNGNVGIAMAPTPVGGAGRLLVNGGIRTRGGAPGGVGANDNGYAFTGNNGDNDSGMFSSADGQVEFYTQSSERMRINGAGNVGIGTTTPTTTLEVNGTVKANNLAVTGTISASAFSGTLNGEDPPLTATTGTANVNTLRDVLIDGTTLLGDEDGGRIRVVLRNHGDRSVRAWEWHFHSDVGNLLGRTDGVAGTMRFDGHGEGFFVLGNSSIRQDMYLVDNWIGFRNYKYSLTGGAHGPAFGAPDRYKFYILASPNISFTVTVFDR